MNYDYIVVGAGTAGCIVAARLSESPDVRVLLVEAGGSDRTPIITMPGALPFAYQNRKIQWGYESGPESHLDGRTIDEKTGRVIGGSSSINAMIYNRGNPMDLEGWAEEGLPDWDYAHCLPYFKKMETFVDGPDDWRGGHGPVHISRCDADHQLYHSFLRAGEEAGFEVTRDHNGYKQEGLHVAQTFIHKGVRWSAARAYLRPTLKRVNLQVMKNALVNRLVIENGVVTGIEVADGSRSRAIRCEREVVLCAGAINTPKLMMLSGLGDPDDLRAHGIAVSAESRQVGRNLQNHPGVDVQYVSTRGPSFVSQLGPVGRVKLAADWVLRKKGLGTTNFFETGAFLRTNDDVTFPNMQYEFLPLTRQKRRGKLIPIPGFQFWMDLSRPKSRGAITLKSANPATHPSIVFNHLQSREDVKDLIDGVRLARAMASQAAWDEYGAEELNPGPDAVSDSDIEAFLRKNVSTSYHPSGTCRMGVDSEAVVDSEARVKAVVGLRVADASIMPRVITGNLNASVMMIAEKISDRIAGRPPLEPSEATFYREP